MTDNQRVKDFILSFGRDRDSVSLRKIREEAERDHIPIIRKETEDLLRVLLKLKKPGDILEVGCAIGFSSVFMADETERKTNITTIENYPPRIIRAKENIKMAGLEHVITLLEGDAAQILPTLSGPYDFIFMDAAKGQYLNFFPEVMRLLAPKGLLISDNVLQDGDIIESRYAIKRRNHTIHNRMRDYLYVLTHTENISTVILESGDGVAVSVKD